MAKKKQDKEELTLYQLIELLAKEKRTVFEVVCNKIEKGFVTAYKDEKKDNTVECRLDVDCEHKSVRFMVKRRVVDVVNNPDTEISFEAAHRISRKYKLGDFVEEEVPMSEVLGRTNIHKMKSIIHQDLNIEYKANSAKQYNERKRDIIDATVKKITDNGDVIVITKYGENVMDHSGFIPGESFVADQVIPILIEEVDMSDAKKPIVKLSRNTPDMVKRLFEKNIPEISDGIVYIKNIAREAGVRTKISVYSKDPAVDAVGACIGPERQRIDRIRAAINDEKIDVVQYYEDHAEYIKSALRPAEVRDVILTTVTDTKGNDKNRRNDRPMIAARVIVDDDVVSLAIGDKGLNARLAAKLTGCKIDVKKASDSL